MVDLVGEGARVQARTPTSAVVEYGERVNHILHLLISVFLCGLWLPVWFFVAMSGGTRLRTLTVDEYGEIHESSPRGFSQLNSVMIILGIALAIVLVLFVVWRFAGH